jgi:tetratricopeptide (TPR) repeat protein
MNRSEPTSRLSHRQRRTLQTAGIVLVAIVLGGAAIVVSSRDRRSAPYTPGEANADITESLARNLPRDAPAPRLVDITREAGLADFVTFAGDRSSQLPEDMGPGAAWGDYDNDGDDDLFLVSAGGPLTAPPERWAPSALFENAGGGRFRRVTDFPEPRVIGLGAAWGDVDGDGWIDLVVTGYNALLLYRNQHGRFVRDTRLVSRPGFWSGASWGDYDNDGDLDLYVCGYVQYVQSDADRAKASDQSGVAVPYTLNPASYDPQPNLLFRNNGAGGFTEVGGALGVANPEGRSLSALWHDFDDDGWLDLYVANDISDNVLYRNTGGRFQDISHAARVGDYRGAMGLAAGDWNRDGDDDLFITHWIAQENALYDSLLKDTGDLSFADAGDVTGLGQIALPMVGWGTEFVDLDGDGWLDLVVANGSTFETDDPPKRLKAQNPFVFWNRRSESFYDLAPLAPALASPHVARGLAVSDFDNDGDVDVLISRHGERVQLLRNDMQIGHWVEVVLRARSGPRAPLRPALGAQAVGYVQGAALRRAVSGASYLSQSTAVLHFGLGDAEAIDRLVVRWRGATVATYTGLTAGRRWEIVEGDPVPRAIVRGDSLLQPAAASPAAPAANQLSDRDRQIAFWDKYRAGMHALKVEQNCGKAIALFREALAYDAAHEDGRYYLGNCLAAQGDIDGALAQYELMTRGNPQSHRGFARWGTLRAITARSAVDLGRAEHALDQAYRLNPEETGALLSLGEVALMRGRRAVAQQRLASVCQTNPRATGGFFLLGYVRWKQGDAAGAGDLLREARKSLGPEWKPKGATAEGDVLLKAHTETTPLSRFWESWDGALAPARAYAHLEAYLKTIAH